MIDADALCRQTRDHQRDLVDQASRTWLVAPADRPAGVTARWRLAHGLRRWADRLEPGWDGASIGTLRALAHGEIDVDQALLLLDLPAGG